MDDAGEDRAREERRRKLIGRAAVIGLLLLVAVYVLATFVR
jgi:hypothetical protein